MKRKTHLPAFAYLKFEHFFSEQFALKKRTGPI
jgi:hypothetical protein